MYQVEGSNDNIHTFSIDKLHCEGWWGLLCTILASLKFSPHPVPSIFQTFQPGRIAQSVGHLTSKSGVLSWIPGLATYFRLFFRFFKRAVVSYWRKYVHQVLVNRLGGLSLSKKSVVRLTDRPDMTLDVYRGRKQQYNNNNQTFHTYEISLISISQ